MHVHVFEAAKKMLEKKGYMGTPRVRFVSFTHRLRQWWAGSYRPRTMTMFPASSGTRPSRPCIASL